MTPPELPAEEPLQRRVGLVDEGAAAALTELLCVGEALRLLVVEGVALAVVGGRAARRLVAELRTPLDRQSLGNGRERGERR